MSQFPGPRLGKSPKPPVSDQREWARHPPSPETTCWLSNESHGDFWVRKIQNISAAGLTLVVDKVIPVGTVLTVELRRDSRRLVVGRSMRVVYLVQEPGGTSILGGAFIKNLTEGEVKELV